MKGHPLAFELHLETETVGHMNLPKPLCVEPSVSVREVLNELKARQSGSVSVCQDGKLVGMFTERDVLNRVVAKQLDPATTKVQDVMTSPVITCNEDCDVNVCAADMSSKKIRHLPVISSDPNRTNLVGVISTGDLMALNVSQKQAQIDHLHEYLHGRA